MLNISFERKSERELRISIDGSIDSETYSDLELGFQEVLSNLPEAVVLDLARLQYINSMGLSFLVKLERALQEREGYLVMINLPAQIKKAIDVISALPSMSVFASREEADEYLLRIQKREIEKDPA